MVFRLPSVISATKQALKLQGKSHGVPKGHVAVYVGDHNKEKKRYVVPLSCLSHPAFQKLLSRAEEEFGFNHPTVHKLQVIFPSLHQSKRQLCLLQSLIYKTKVLRLPSMISATKQALKLQNESHGIRKEHVTVYVGDYNEEKKRYLVPLSCLKHPAFQKNPVLTIPWALNRQHKTSFFENPLPSLQQPKGSIFAFKKLQYIKSHHGLPAACYDLSHQTDPKAAKQKPWIYVGDHNKQKKRYVVPLSCLSHPAFRKLLSRAEEEFGFNHPTGGLTIPCDEQTFARIVSYR
ncbi:hypothetical protein Cgig2_002894 [Carnegiea gigantea]|uniref:Uncharacterized protein n=1 Tax=Carnegiea gigantea TaxID=171969 RepID=A0A9Q1KQA4_9CARY|nr:hypothetical protein Cgig2_002894 [Carnegiea gigantea]